MSMDTAPSVLGQEPRQVRIGGAVATGWFAEDLRNCAEIVAAWPDSMKPACCSQGRTATGSQTTEGQS